MTAGGGQLDRRNDMARKEWILALGTILVASPLAAQPDMQPIVLAATGTAPAGGPDTRYCMKVDPITGQLMETIQCWTRGEWAEQGVDVDKEWAKNGVKVEEPVRA
jgi:hypothetical protein